MSDFESPEVKPTSSGKDQGDDTAPDKDQYSLDDMMKRLRDQEREKEEKGEVVTRSDGTIARKVKRRRRRSDQPESKSKKSPVVKKNRLILKVVLGTSLFLFALLGALFILLKFNSKGYRESTQDKVAEWTGAEVDFDGLKLYPSAVTMSRASLTWPKESYVRELQMTRISGHANPLSFFGAKMGGQEIGGSVGTLSVQLPRGESSVGQNLDADDFPFNFQRYFCESLDINFGEGSDLALSGVNSSLRHLGGEGFRVTIDQGLFNLEGWESFPISNGALDFKEGAMEISNLALEVPRKENELRSSATINLSGAIQLAEGSESVLNLETNNFPLETLFGDKLGKLVSGNSNETKGQVFYDHGSQSFREIQMEFSAETLTVSRFPFVQTLDELFPNAGFDSLEFDTDISGVFRARSDGFALEQLQMSDQKRINLEGVIFVNDAGEIRGKMNMWVNRGLINPDPKIKSLPGFQKKGEVEGYAKLTFDLGGTVKLPSDNFRAVTGLATTSPGSFRKKDPILEKDAWELLLNGN